MSAHWGPEPDLENLTPLSQAILLALGAIGQPAARGHVAQTLVKSKVAPQAEPWIRQPADMNSLLENLQRDGLAVETRGYWTLAPRVRERVCRDAFQRGVLKSLATAGQAGHGTGQVLLDPLQRDLVAFRLAFFENRTEDWMGLQDRMRASHAAALGMRDPLALIAAEPFEAEWFESLPPALQSHAAWALLHDSVLHDHRHEAFRAWMDGRSRTKPSPLAPMLEFLLLEGRLEEARTLLGRLKAEQRTLTPILLLEAALELASGQAIEAAARFEAVLTQLAGKGVKRKTVHLPGLMDLFCILAFLGRQDEVGLKAASDRLDLLGRRGAMDPLRALHGPLTRLVLLRRGEPARAESLPERAPALLRFTGLLVDYLAETRLSTTAVQDVATRMDGLPMGLFVRELQELGRRVGGAMASGHFPFLDVVSHSEGWEKALESLKGLGRTRSDERAGRLAWWIYRDPESRAPYVIEPREQRQDARGQWTRGKAISLKRLKEESKLFDFLVNADQSLLACIREGWRGFELDFEAALKGLVGHPVVFWSEGEVDEARHVDVVEGQPELVIRRDGDRLELRLVPTLDEQEVQVRVEGPRRVAILAINGQHRKLAEVVGQGLSVPAKAEAQVLEALGAVAPMVAVRSDVILGKDAAKKAGMERIAGDPLLHLLLMPFHQGLKAQLRVQPMLDGGYAPPGEGGASLLLERRGRKVLVERDLRAEAEAAAALRKALPSLPLDEGAMEWAIDDPERCMNLMLELEAVGDQVKLQWPEGGRLNPPRTIGANAMRLTVKRSGNWFDVDGQVTLDDGQVLQLQDLLDVSRESRFIQLGEGRVVALADTFRRRLEDLRALGEAKGKGLRLSGLSALALNDLGDELGAFKADAAWLAQAAKLKEAMSLDPDVPASFKADLRSYQRDGYRWMMRLASAGLGACLADDMGLGKTVQTLAVLRARAELGPTLVLAPTSVCANWIHEAEVFAPDLRVQRFGDGDRSTQLDGLGPFDVLVCSYGLLQLEAERLQKIEWGTAVLDEGQAIKNAFTKRSQAVMELKAGFRLLLSGTPVENHLGELWNLFQFVNPGLLGTLERFRTRFQEPIERGEDPEVGARLRRIVGPFLLRRTKGEVLGELPPRTEITLELDPTPEEASFLEALRRQSLMDLETQQRAAFQVLAAISRLRRACCNPRLVQPDVDLPSSKLEAFLELVDELRENGHRALVFSQFVDHLGLLREALDARGVTYQYLDGSTPARKRTAAVKAFQAGEGELFLISLKAGGTGLNLTAADYVIHMDPWWNPAVEDQASDRAHRMGQTRPVTVYRLVIKGSIEQKILALHAHKRQLADDLLAEGAAAAQMDTDALLALLREG